MAMHENQQKVLVFKDRSGVELPMIDGYVPKDSVSAAGVDIATNRNIANHPYPEKKTYQDLANDEDDNDDDDDYGDDDNNNGNGDIEIVASPIAITGTIIDVDKENTGVPDKNIGVATSDDREITGVPSTEDDNMSKIDAAIAEVAATLDQELREVKLEPEETKDA